METKELNFNGFKMNGFFALFLHLVVLTAMIVGGFVWSVPAIEAGAAMGVQIGRAHV